MVEIFSTQFGHVLKNQIMTKIIRRMLLASFFLFTSTHNLDAQVTSSYVFTNGRLALINGTSGITNLNDSLLGICTVDEKVYPRVIKAKILRKTNLSLKNEIVLPYPQNVVFQVWNFFIDQNQVYLILSLVGVNQNQEIMYAYKLNGQFNGLQTLFVDTIPNDNRIINNIGIFDNHIYITRCKRINIADTLTIEKYNLAGSLVAQKMHNDSLTFSGRTINRVYRWGPYQHPTKPNELVYGFYGWNKVACIDKTTLDTTFVMKDPNYHFPFTKYLDGGYQLYADRITCSGSVYFIYDLFTNPQFDWQMFFSSRNWAGDSLYDARIGQIGVEEKGYAYTASQAHNQYIVAGSFPFNNYVITAPEYRQIAIYRFNEGGFLDTLVLYGNKNHVPFSLLAEPNGDLFMLSTYTDAWTTDSTYFQIDKIPAFLIGLVENKLVSPEIIMFPNPTVDWVRLDIGEKPLAVIEVYNQQGQLLLREENPATNEISIANLPASIYIVVAKLEKGESFSALVKKE
jgi:hypothetical protein